MSKSLLLAALLLVGASVMAPAFALTYEAAPVNADGSAKFADPDDLADGMADGMSGSSTTSTGGSFHMFGIGNAALGYGMERSSVGIVTSHGALRRPYDPNDPATHP